MYYDHPTCPYGCTSFSGNSDFRMQNLYDQIPKEENGRFSFEPCTVICPMCSKKFVVTVNIDYIFESRIIE